MTKRRTIEFYCYFLLLFFFFTNLKISLNYFFIRTQKLIFLSLFVPLTRKTVSVLQQSEILTEHFTLRVKELFAHYKNKDELSKKNFFLVNNFISFVRN